MSTIGKIVEFIVIVLILTAFIYAALLIIPRLKPPEVTQNERKTDRTT